MNNGSFIYGLVAALALLGLGAGSARSQSVYYVRAGASGAGNGSDWSNAYTSLPATLERGATYYVAGGSYPRYEFNTPESGTAVVTVKKASPTDHGTDAGWAARYGTRQAVFSTAFNISRGYFVLDGQYRNESNWFAGAAYGFKIQNNGDWGEQHMKIKDPNGVRAVPNVTIKYLFIAAIMGLPPSSGYRPFAIDTETFSSAIRNVDYVFSHIFVEGTGQAFFLRTLINPLLEYCATSKQSGSAIYHGETVNFLLGDKTDIHAVVRYNHFRDVYNGASGISGGATGVIGISNQRNIAIYGNVFDGWGAGDGAIAAGWENYDIKVYNNTFVNQAGASPIVQFTSASFPSAGNEAYNNLSVNASSLCNGQGAFGNNYSDSPSIFVDFSGRDYRLARHSRAGRDLPSPYHLDLGGKPRRTDGVWDCGAYQYSNPNTNPVIAISLPTLGFGNTRTNTSREMTLRVQNVGGGILAGTASVADPFQIISGAPYSLGANQSQDVRVLYKPVATGSNSQTLTFSGGGGATVFVSGTGEP